MASPVMGHFPHRNARRRVPELSVCSRTMPYRAARPPDGSAMTWLPATGNPQYRHSAPKPRLFRAPVGYPAAISSAGWGGADSGLTAGGSTAPTVDEAGAEPRQAGRCRQEAHRPQDLHVRWGSLHGHSATSGRPALCGEGKCIEMLSLGHPVLPPDRASSPPELQTPKKAGCVPNQQWRLSWHGL